MSGRRRAFHALSDRQHRFVTEYLIDLNIAAAARRAGYSPATAHAPNKVITPAVQQAIDDAIQRRAQRTAVAADKVVAELAKLAFSNMADFFTVGPDGLPRFDLRRLTRDDAAAIQSLTVDYWRPPLIRKRERDSAAARSCRSSPVHGGGGREADGGGLPPTVVEAAAPTTQTSDPEDLPRRHDVPITIRRVRIQLADKRAALIDLARHLGMAGHDSRHPDGEASKDEAGVYKFIHVVTGVPRQDEPTGLRGHLMQIAGPGPCPIQPAPPETDHYRQALAERSTREGD